MHKQLKLTPDRPITTDKTLALGVDNMGFMLDRLGKDCAPLQFLRELTQNSIEAIGRTGEKKGLICWDVDWNRYDLEGDGIFKLSIVDDGDGMTGPEMVQFINNLSSSIRPQSLQGNYGIGAKIAAATRNHVGLLYLSWKNGKGAMIHLWRAPETGQYGLRQFEQPNGVFDYWLPLEADIKPDQIKEHGTMVVLLGNSLGEHTMNAPVGAASPSRWIAKYLNARYFRFPEGITVKAREGWENPRTDTDRNVLRSLVGQNEYLSDHAEFTGSVGLTDAKAHWWILKDESASGQNSGFINSSGHVAALHNDELYEIETSRSGVSRLQQFGVIFGYPRVVIYVEPCESEDVQLTTNTARTQLLINSEPLPWAEWASQFRDRMPDAIRNLVTEVAAGSTSKDHSQSIKERLAQIKDLFNLTRYKPTPKGNVFIDDNATRHGGKPLIQALKRPSVTGQGTSPGGKGGRAGDVYASFAVDQGSPASEVAADSFPQVRWVSVADGTRESGVIEDRAATYLSEQNQIHINADFRVFSDMIKRYERLNSNIPGASEVITETVKEWFEQSLIETVLGVQALQGAREWSIEDISQALSDEALSAAIMPRYHIDNAIKRALSLKLGSQKQKM